MPDRQQSELSLQDDKTFYSKWVYFIKGSYLLYNSTAV